MTEYEKFYGTTKPLKRLEKLKGLMEMNPAPEGLDFAKELFFRRFDKNDENLSVDRFLYNCIMFIAYGRKSVLFRGREKRDILKMLSNMGIGEAGTKAEQDILHAELKNTAKRYFETCSSPKYKKKLFGLMESSDDEKLNHMKIDAEKMTVFLAEKHDIKNEMAPWIAAVQEACDEVLKNMD